MTDFYDSVVEMTGKIEIHRHFRHPQQCYTVLFSQAFHCLLILRLKQHKHKRLTITLNSKLSTETSNNVLISNPSTIHTKTNEILTSDKLQRSGDFFVRSNSPNVRMTL